jgi:hypothetical protein
MPSIRTELHAMTPNATPNRQAQCPPALRGESVCPAQAHTALLPDDALCFPLARRSVVQRDQDEQGSERLRLFHGDHELEFDDPRFFGFGEALARADQFVARDAMAWGQGYAWAEVEPLLAQLRDEGLLIPANRRDQMPDAARVGPRPSPLPAAQTTLPRDWHDCEAITAQLTGRALPLAHLELVVPIFRIAHMALDADGRQVGESNVFPMPLRLDVPTEWRTCVYPGSRYLDDKPMNVTALKAMRAHWPVVVAALSRVREAYVQRFPAAAQAMTLADVECLSTLVLALPAYMLMRQSAAVANGYLHPALSSMFRVTDGLRMVSHQMLFVPVGEATWLPDAVVSASDIHDYAERNQSFHSSHGVCAGPSAMISAFLQLMVDGRLPADAAVGPLPDDVEAALGAIDQAFAYGLLGLQAHATVFSLWPIQTRCWARLGELIEAWPEPHGPQLARLREHLAETMQLLTHQSLHATEAWRRNRETVYEAIHQHTAQGLGEPDVPPLRSWLDGQLDPSQREASTLHIATMLRARWAPADDADRFRIDVISELLVDVIGRTQAVLQRAETIQGRINTLLGRAAAPHPFHALDIDIHVLLQGHEARRLPHLLDGLAELLGIRLDISAQHIHIEEVPATALAPLSPICPHGAGK